MNLFLRRNFQPMLLSEVKKPFDSDDFIYEMKFDGYRALVFVSPKSIFIQSRNKVDLTSQYPELEKIKKIVDKPTVFDGEIVSFQNGVPSFSSLQKRGRLSNKHKIEKESIENPVVFVCFDILYYGKDLTTVPLLKRKKVLNNFSDSNVFMKTFFVEKNGISLFKKIKKRNLEGIVAKRKDSLYEINKRVDYWIKIKNVSRDFFYIGGYSENSGSNVFSLYLGEYVNNELSFVGKVFTSKKNGFYETIKKMQIKKSPFVNKEDGCFFVKPKLQVLIEYLERSSNGGLRHAVFIKLKN